MQISNISPIVSQASSIANQTSIVSHVSNSENTILEIKQFNGIRKQPEIGKIARTWQKQAHTMELKANKLRDPSEQVYRDAGIISVLIAECIEKQSKLYGEIYTQIFVCRDDERNPQSIALTNHMSGPDGHLKIAHLVTNPKNIRSASINQKQTKRVQGAATAIIVHLAKQCFAKKIAWKNKSKNPDIKGIYLESTSSAISFYEKLGFERIPDLKPEEEFCIPMRLKVEKMQELVFTKG